MNGEHRVYIQLQSSPSQEATAVTGANSSANRSHPIPASSAERSNPRQATDAQVRAIRTIASKAGLSLASELEQGYGVRNPNQLTIAQASQLIDSMKQNLAPSAA